MNNNYARFDTAIVASEIQTLMLCNAKRCNCCMHLCTNSTVTSSVNGRKFSVVNNSDLD